MKIDLTKWVNDTKRQIERDTIWAFIDAVEDISDSCITVAELKLLARLMYGNR